MISQDAEKICVYCKKRKPNSDFNKEHVIPVSFGKFKKGMTLLHTVCRECNSYFANHLENDLGRDSLYGVVYRSSSGVVDAAEFHKQKKHKKKLSDAYVYHYEYGNLLVDLTDFSPSAHSQFIVSLASQAIVMNSTKGIKANFRINYQLNRSFLEAIGLCPKAGYVNLFFPRLFAIEEYEKSKMILEKCGVDVGMRKSQLAEMYLGNSSPNLYFHSILDKKILRAIAKIAFNYFVSQYGSNVALGEEFDNIREYIRCGTYVSYRVVVPLNKKIAYKNLSNGQIKMGHILIIKQNMQGDTVVWICLFNSHLYEVILSKKYLVALPKVGSFFDTDMRVVETYEGQNFNSLFRDS